MRIVRALLRLQPPYHFSRVPRPGSKPTSTIRSTSATLLDISPGIRRWRTAGRLEERARSSTDGSVVPLRKTCKLEASAAPNPARPISPSPTTPLSTRKCNSTPPGGATERAGVGGRTGGTATVSGRVGPPRPSTPTSREPSSSTSSIEKKTNSCGGASPPEFSARRATPTRRSTKPCPGVRRLSARMTQSGGRLPRRRVR